MLDMLDFYNIVFLFSIQETQSNYQILVVMAHRQYNIIEMQQYYSIQIEPASRISLQEDNPNHLQQRIRKIKSKYGNPKQKYNSRQYIQSKLNYSVCDEINTSKISKCESALAISMLDASEEHHANNKENSMADINSSKANRRQSQKLKNVVSKGQKRIQQLQQINGKIARLIQCLKIEQNSNQVDNNLKASNSGYSTRILTQQEDTLKTAKLQNKVEKPKLKLAKQNRHNRSVLVIKNFEPNCTNKLVRQCRSVESQQSSCGSGQIYSREIGKLSRAKSITQSATLLKNADVLNYEACVKQKNHKRLMGQLTKQIELDRIFVQKKTKLIRKGIEAKKQLQSAVGQGNWTLHQKQLLLQWSFEDIDPLYTERQSSGKKNQQDTNQLVFSTLQSFIKCQSHWKHNIQHKFVSDQLNLHDLDMEGKGYFLKEDLTRFLSLQTRSMYCNRDINLVFKRLNKKKNKIVAMKQFISSICYK